MYELNTKQGKEYRIKRLEELIRKTSRRELNLDDEREIIEYLKDIKTNLQGQLLIK